MARSIFAQAIALSAVELLLGHGSSRRILTILTSFALFNLALLVALRPASRKSAPPSTRSWLVWAHPTRRSAARSAATTRPAVHSATTRATMAQFPAAIALPAGESRPGELAS